VTTRRAKISDAEAIARVTSSVAEEGWLAMESPIDLEAHTRAVRERVEHEDPTAVWVLEDSGRVVGSASAAETAAGGVLSLGMAILSSARGRGGGRALLEAVLDHARCCGAHKVELEVWPDNARAIALYASTGFEIEGVRRDHYRRRDGRLRSALVMARRFDNPNAIDA
jgi:RimJ/RimL family protein N-acetyltransferase